MAHSIMSGFAYLINTEGLEPVKEEEIKDAKSIGIIDKPSEILQLKNGKIVIRQL